MICTLTVLLGRPRVDVGDVTESRLEAGQRTRLLYRLTPRELLELPEHSLRHLARARVAGH